MSSTNTRSAAGADQFTTTSARGVAPRQSDQCLDDTEAKQMRFPAVAGHPVENGWITTNRLLRISGFCGGGFTFL